MLFGMAGVAVTDTERGADGRLTVWARITLPAVCPGCGIVSEKVHQYAETRPRDVRACGRDVDFCLVKRRMKCAAGDCPRKTFTESVPQVPPRCTITRRLLEQAGAEVADRGITPAEAARRRRHFLALRARRVHGKAADQVLDEEIAPVAHLGHR